MMIAGAVPYRRFGCAVGRKLKQFQYDAVWGAKKRIVGIAAGGLLIEHGFGCNEIGWEGTLLFRGKPKIGLIK